ncbi:hypothetical protein pb186bvf_016338 [Paramecium bursaria]
MGENYVYDQQIFFDESSSTINLKPGEKIFVQQNDIEDSKGNFGSLGIFQVTNIRIIWVSNKSSRLNLSIGLGTVYQSEIKLQDSQSGLCYGLLFRTKQNAQKFEFLFSAKLNTPFLAFKEILNIYLKTTLYRQVKISSALIQQKQLTVLPKEQIMNKYVNTFSVQMDKNDVQGTLILSNIRFVWFSNGNELFNFSSPWIAIKSIQKKSLKQQWCVVIETHKEFGSAYQVGYYHQQFEQILKEMQKLKEFYQENPIYGIDFQQKGTVQEQKQDIQESVEIINSGYNTNSYKIQNDNENYEIEYNKDLGICIEKLPPGTTIKDLWCIIK